MVSAVCGGIRVVSLYAPNGRVVGSPFYAGKLKWFERLRRWLDETASPDEPLILGGDLNATPSDEDVWDAVAAHGGTHVSEPERAALRASPRLGPRGRLSPGRAGRCRPLLVVGLPGRDVPPQRRGCGSTCCYVTKPVADRLVWAEIDREARKGPPIPSDHAPVVVDLDERGLRVRGRLGRRVVPDQGPDPAAADQESRLIRCRPLTGAPGPRLTLTA